MEKFYTVKEVLDMLRISRATLYRHIETGLIKPVKLGKRTLFTESDLNEFVERLKKAR